MFGPSFESLQQLDYLLNYTGCHQTAICNEGMFSHIMTTDRWCHTGYAFQFVSGNNNNYSSCKSSSHYSMNSLWCARFPKVHVHREPGGQAGMEMVNPDAGRPLTLLRRLCGRLVPSGPADDDERMQRQRSLLLLVTKNNNGHNLVGSGRPKRRAGYLPLHSPLKDKCEFLLTSVLEHELLDGQSHQAAVLLLTPPPRRPQGCNTVPVHWAL